MDSAVAVLAGRLRVLLQEHGLSYEEFGRLFGVPKPTVGHYLNARTEMPFDLLRQIARHFNVSTDWLLGLADERHGPAAGPPGLAEDLQKLAAAGFTLAEIVVVAEEMTRHFAGRKKKEPGG